MKGFGSLARRAAGLACVAAALPVLACGFEDTSSIATLRGALNVVYPQSLQVGTAIWQAQASGRLPRSPVATWGELAPDARAALQLQRAEALLEKFSARLAAQAVTPRASLAVILLGPVMWNRFEFSGSAVRPLLHVDGPKPGDVVVVTDIAVIEAVGSGTLALADALRGGFVRLYGPAADVEDVRNWLSRGSPAG